MKKPLIIGHRGASRFLPENTMESFRFAFEKFRVPMIEFDVHTSKDGIPVILHDARLERTTDGRGDVRHFMASELKKYDAGFRFDPEKKGGFPCRGKQIRIPAFEELLQTFPDKELSVEIKERSPELVHKVISLIQKYHAESRCIVGSRYHVVSKTMKEHYPHIRRFASQNEIIWAYFSYKTGEKNPVPDPQLVFSMPLERCGLDFGETRFIDFLHLKKGTVFFWTINDTNLMKELAAKGADGLITDDPSLWKCEFS